MTYPEIISKVSESIGMSKDLIDKTYKAYWKTIRDHITSLPLKEDLNEEEFNKLQPNINIPSIGKLYVTYDRYKRMKKRNEIIKTKIKENATHKEN